MKNTLIFLALVLTTPAWAINLTFMKDSPLSRLNKEEVTLYRGFLIEALNGPEGSTREWKAPHAEFTSKVTPAAPFRDGTYECRDVAIEADAGNRYSRGTYTFCRSENSIWRLKNPARAGKRK